MCRALVSFLLLSACDGLPPGTGTDSGADSGYADTGLTGDDTGGDTDSGGDAGSGIVGGMVYVQLYREDASGDTELVSWEDYGANFPFGSIFVAAYTVDETTGALTYHAQDVILAPSTEGDAYTLTLPAATGSDMYVYATLDYMGDGVLGTWEPLGVYPDPVVVLADDTVSGVDITIQAQIFDGGGGGPGDGDTGGVEAVTLSGTLDITEPYTGGGAKVLLYDSAGSGPYYVDSVTPTATADGAEAVWDFEVPANYGQNRLLGAWDSNQNYLIDPMDTWGAYVVAGENANPITIGADDLSELAVEIPFGLAPALTPFVRLEGTLSYEGDFSTLPAGSTVYVAALRTRPSGDFSVAQLTDGFDWSSFTGAALTGTELDYLLIAPSNETAYLWAYGDLDNDGVLNEVGEPVASFGRTGRIATGTTNQSDVDMPLQMVTE
jgi:hypothetical protein